MKMLRSVLLSLFIAMVSFPAMGDDYALIMGISNYPQQPLLGVAKDIKTAHNIAKLIGIPDENIITKKDNELTKEGLRRSLVEFENKIINADKVFIYFSGHGMSYSVDNGICKQVLVAQDTGYLTKEDLYEELRKIAKKSKKMFVFLDTCFSGGMISAGKGLIRQSQPVTIKFFQDQENDICSTETNYVPQNRDFSIESVGHDRITNYYLLVSAASDEAAIDGGAAVGGLATSSFYKCISTSSITLKEAKKCAQEQVNALINKYKENDPSFAYNRQTLIDNNGPGSDMIINANASCLAVDSIVPDKIKKCIDLTNKVVIKSQKRIFKINRDYLELSIATNKSGYLTIIFTGTSGKTFQLFPNKFDSKNRIEARKTITLPRNGWRIPANGPEGEDHFVAIVSESPFSKEKIENLFGNFSTITRDFSVEKDGCADSYGIGVLTVKEKM